MSSPSGSAYETFDDRKGPETKIAPEAVTTERSLFHRSDGKTFETDSELESLYAPIAEYEGRHRYDPQFVWDKKDEKKVVRKVC